MGFKSFSSLSVICLLMASSCIPQKATTGSKLLSEGGSASVAAQPLSVSNNVAPTADVGVSKVVAGTQHSCALQSGKISCWGLNKHGQIGNGESGVIENMTDPLTGSNYTVRVALAPFAIFNGEVSDLALGFEHTCVIKNEELFCWGSNEYGQLGINPASTDSKEKIFPRPVSILTGVKQVAAQGRWTCVVAKSQLLCFGTRLVNEGSGVVPKLISRTPKIMISSDVASVSVSANHACAVLTSGGSKCFGMNAMGEVGIGDASGMDVLLPGDVFSDGVSAVSLANGRSCFLRTGVPYCAGASLGDRAVDASGGGWKVASPTPYAATFWNSLEGIRKISASGTAISASGDLFYGSYFHSNGAPQKIALGVIDFNYSESDLGGCMMFRNHDVKCWGPNLFGQLGTGKRSAEEFSVFKAQDALLPK